MAEIEIGLGTPRPTIRLQRNGGLVQLVRPSDGQDLTAKMRTWAEERDARDAEDRGDQNENETASHHG